MMDDRDLTPKELAHRWKTTVERLKRQRYLKQGPRYRKLGRLVRYPLKWVLAYEAAG